MDKWDYVGVGILVLLFFMNVLTMYCRDGFCLFREECWIKDVKGVEYYGGFWCDCDNFIQRANIIVKNQDEVGK